MDHYYNSNYHEQQQESLFEDDVQNLLSCTNDISQSPFRLNCIQQSDPIPTTLSVKTHSHRPILAETLDSGNSSMITPATTWGSVFESGSSENINIYALQQERTNGSSFAGVTISGNILSPTSVGLKRSSMNDPQSDENKRWKTNEESQGFESQPIVIEATVMKTTSASCFPSANDTLPNYKTRFVQFAPSAPIPIQNGRTSLGGSNHRPANVGAHNGLARSQPTGQQKISLNAPNFQLIGQPVDVNQMEFQTYSQNIDMSNKYIIDQNSQKLKMETSANQEVREKCSPHTSKSLQEFFKRQTDSLVNLDVQTTTQTISSNGVASTETQLSVEDEKKRRQQEKNRQYAKESRDRKNEKLKTLDQRTKEQSAQIEILRKVIAHYYVKLHGSEPQWTEDIREWFSSQGGNSQTPVQVISYLPNDKEMLKEIGNSAYGSVISPMKSKHSSVKRNSVDMLDDSADYGKISPSNSASSRGENLSPGNTVSPSKGQSARALLFSSRSRDRDSFEQKMDVKLACDAESNVDVVQDMNILKAHRQEESYSVGLFSGSRTELKPRRKLETEYLSPWSTSYPDNPTDMAEEEVTTSSEEETKTVILIPDVSQDALIDGFSNLSSIDFLTYTEECIKLAQLDPQGDYKI